MDADSTSARSTNFHNPTKGVGGQMHSDKPKTESSKVSVCSPELAVAQSRQRRFSALGSFP